MWRRIPVVPRTGRSRAEAPGSRRRRGHLTRRTAVTWGDTSRHAKRASNKEVFEPGTEWRSSLTTGRYTWFTTILFTDRLVSYRTHLTDTEPMSKLLALVGATLGGAVGWWLGMFIGFMTAFILSMIGTGLGVYAGRRFAAEYLL